MSLITLNPASSGAAITNYLSGYNVQLEYGAAGNNSTDDTSAIQAAINAAYAAYIAGGGGGIVFMPPGIYRTSTPLLLPRNVILMGTGAPRWFYDVGSTCMIRPTSGFTGAAVVLMQDETQGSYSSYEPVTTTYSIQGGQQLRGFSIDGSAQTATAVDGIQAQGQVLSVVLDNVTVSGMSGNGLRTVTETESAVLVYAKGWRLRGVSAESCAGAGFDFNNLTDSNIDECWANSNTGDGFTFNTFGEDHMTGCHSVFNGGNGYTFTGQSGGFNIPSISTDRNEGHGVAVTCSSGSAPVTIGTATLRRDGSNSDAGGGSYAGLYVDTTSCPVIVGTLVTTIGLDDGASSGNPSPEYGLSVITGSATTTINTGYIWGYTAAVNGSYSLAQLGPLVTQAVGGTGVYGALPTTVTNGGLLAASSVPGTPAQGATPLLGSVYYARKQVASINGDGVTTVYTINHSIGTSNVTIGIRDFTGAVVLVSPTDYTWVPTSGSVVTVTFAAAPAAAEVLYVNVQG